MANSDLEEIEELIELAEEEDNERHRSKVYLNRPDPFVTYSNNKFRKRYRFSKVGAEQLYGMLADYPIPPNNSGLPISPRLQLLVTLNVYAAGAYQGTVAELHGLSQPTLSRIIKNISIALARLRREVIKFPVTRPELRNSMLEFHRIARFPKIIGCIDCTHVKIRNPGGPNPQAYINRKNFFSLNVQAVSSASLKFINIVARWRGSTHDARIFHESSLKRTLENREYDGILLGDSGYPCLPYLLTPVRNPQTEAELAYNLSLNKTRNVVERLFGVWKMTFRSLHRGLTGNLETSKAMIVAMAVLHNLRMQFREEDSDDSEEEVSDDEDYELEEDPIEEAAEIHRGGNAFRRHFIAAHFAQ